MPKAPSSTWKASVASESAGVAAGEKVLLGDVHLALTLRVDADPVRHGRDGPEGPARAAAPLVSDLLDGGTVRPLSPGVPAGRQLVRVSHQLQLRQSVLVSVRVDSHQGAEVLLAGLGVETDNRNYTNCLSERNLLLSASSPGRVGCVQLVNEVVREDVVVVLGLHHHTGDHHQK